MKIIFLSIIVLLTTLSCKNNSNSENEVFQNSDHTPILTETIGEDIELFLNQNGNHFNLSNFAHDNVGLLQYNLNYINEVYELKQESDLIWTLYTEPRIVNFNIPKEVHRDQELDFSRCISMKFKDFVTTIGIQIQHDYYFNLLYNGYKVGEFRNTLIELGPTSFLNISSSFTSTNANFIPILDQQKVSVKIIRKNLNDCREVITLKK